MGNNLQKSNYPGHFVSEGKRVGDKNEIAKLFNNFFTNIGPDLAKQITVPDYVSVLDYLTNKNLKSMFLSPTDDSEVTSKEPVCPRVELILKIIIILLIIFLGFIKSKPC